MMPMTIMFHAMLTHEEDIRILTKMTCSHNLSLLRLILPRHIISRIQVCVHEIDTFM